MSAAPQSLQKQNLERLQSELATRHSTLHYAHAAVTLIISMIMFAAGCKLIWDSKQSYWMAYAAFGIALALLGYGLLRYLTARRLVKQEEARWAELTKLRSELNLDDPSKLLPPV